MADLEMWINGSQVPAEVLRYIGDVVVDDSVELPSMFTFVVTTSDAQKASPWVWVDNKDLFSIGTHVEIKMSSGDGLRSLIIGEVTALEPEFVADRLPVLNVQGYDRRHRLQRGRRTRTFLDMKDSDIAAQIGREAGLNVQEKESGNKLDYVMQANQTDWEFLNQRARLIGYEVAVEDRTLFFRPVGNDQDEIHTLDIRKDLMEFYPRLSSTGQATEGKVQSWSMKDKKVVLGKSEDSREVSRMGGQLSGAAIGEGAFGTTIDVVIDQPVGGQAEAQQIAKARFNKLVRSTA